MHSLLLIMMVALMTGGCQAKASGKEEDSRLKVLSTIAMIDDLVKEIGADRINHKILIVGDLDPHSYELVKGDKEKFEEADLIFYNGLGLEHGLSLRKQLEKNPKAIGLGDIVLESFPHLILSSGGQHDPHIWLDISLWQLTVDPLVEALTKCDPTNANFYIQRAEELKKRLQEADGRIFEKLQRIDESQRYLVTCHAAFDYFARRYLATAEERSSGLWKRRVSSPEGLSPEAQVSFVDLEAVVDHIKKYNISVLFFETNINLDSIKKIHRCLEKEGIKVRLAQRGLLGDAMGDGSYIDMIEYNAEMLIKEL